MMHTSNGWHGRPMMEPPPAMGGMGPNAYGDGGMDATIWK